MDDSSTVYFEEGGTREEGLTVAEVETGPRKYPFSLGFRPGTVGTGVSSPDGSSQRRGRRVRDEGLHRTVPTQGISGRGLPSSVPNKWKPRDQSTVLYNDLVTYVPTYPSTSPSPTQSPTTSPLLPTPYPPTVHSLLYLPPDLLTPYPLLYLPTHPPPHPLPIPLSTHPLPTPFLPTPYPIAYRPTPFPLTPVSPINLPTTNPPPTTPTHPPPVYPPTYYLSDYLVTCLPTSLSTYL